MSGRSQCTHCGTALGSGANYCSECGTPHALVVLDRLGVEDPRVITGTDMPHARLRMLVGLVVVVAMLAVLWGLTRGGDSADDAPLGSETPDVGIDGSDVTTSTEVVSTTAPTIATLAPVSASPATSPSPSTASERLFVNDVQGPVLGDDVDGVLVQLIGRTMRQIDLATGAIERIALEHPVYSGAPGRGIVINGELVSFWVRVITVTDLSEGSQRQLIDIVDGSLDMRLAGRARADSVWLATYPGPQGVSAAIEVDVDGEVRRRVEVPQPFSIEWADGDELILGSVDGSWRYDTETGVSARMSGRVVEFARGLVVTASCRESLECDVLVDRGSGPEGVDWLSASDVFNGSIEVSPDLSGALVHVYREQGAAFTFIDLGTGSRVDLGELPIDPYLGVVWVEGSRWIIGHEESSASTLLAVDTATGTQVDLEFPSDIQRESLALSLLGPSGTAQSFLAFIPSN